MEKTGRPSHEQLVTLSSNLHVSQLLLPHHTSTWVAVWFPPLLQEAVKSVILRKVIERCGSEVCVLVTCRHQLPVAHSWVKKRSTSVKFKFLSGGSLGNCSQRKCSMYKLRSRCTCTQWALWRTRANDDK